MNPVSAALAVLAGCGALGACAYLSGVTPIGPGLYMATAHSNDVNGSRAAEKDKVIARATAFCAERGQHVEVTRVDVPDRGPGQAPQAEVDFRCG